MESHEHTPTKDELVDEILADLSSSDAETDVFLTAPRPEDQASEDTGENHHADSKPMEGDMPDHDQMDHEHMHFEMFRRDASGKVSRVDPKRIPRDKSGYDKEGNDPAIGAPAPERPASGGHDQHGGHAHNAQDPAPPKPRRTPQKKRRTTRPE